mmetsp:Transcript_91304/g.185861  ORF Transcript_91304/g.185861 Transcript_91304/m.185861 type:complete len:620 (-) Transcript_91304:135-1994(-)
MRVCKAAWLALELCEVVWAVDVASLLQVEVIRQGGQSEGNAPPRAPLHLAAAPGFENVALKPPRESPSTDNRRWVEPARGYDWLYDVEQTKCVDELGDDMATRSLAARLVFVAAVFLTTAGVFLISPRDCPKGGRRSGQEQEEAPDQLPSRPRCGSRSLEEEDDDTEAECAYPDRGKQSTSAPFAGDEKAKDLVATEANERRWHLDFARLLCVACVVTEHSGGTTYTQHNVGFVLQWILPYLFITSGVCFMLSKGALAPYVGRLTILFFVGFFANAIANRIAHRRVINDLGNTIFQMFYCLILIVLALATALLRQGLRWRQENRTTKVNFTFKAYAAFWLTLTVVGAVYYLSGLQIITVNAGDNDWFAYNADVLINFDLILLEIGGLFFLSSLAVLLGTTDMIGWLLLALIYIPRVVFPWNQVGYPHNVQLYVWGMVTESIKLRGSEMIGRTIRCYWMLWLVVLLILFTPGHYGRCDLHPAANYWERFRFYSIECFLSVSFVTGAWKMDDPMKLMEPLGYWAIFAYAFHVAFARVIPAPYGVLSIAAFIPVFMGLNIVRRLPCMAGEGILCCGSRAKQETEKAEPFGASGHAEQEEDRASEQKSSSSSTTFQPRRSTFG